MDATDRRIVNGLQGGFPITERPFAETAATLDLTEDALIERLGRLLAEGRLSRFGPLYNAERLGGAVTLAAMAVPEAEFDRVAEAVNAHAEVAHNYARDHELNMWFVISTDRPQHIDEVIEAIEEETGLTVFEMPKLEEFTIGLRFEL
ncbi:MAG: Lrp/AsnC family transcriptional regulator [Alphaproteobacteria bacterium]